LLGGFDSPVLIVQHAEYPAAPFIGDLSPLVADHFKELHPDDAPGYGNHFDYMDWVLVDGGPDAYRRASNIRGLYLRERGERTQDHLGPVVDLPVYNELD
jgi:hypothetical protein